MDDPGGTDFEGDQLLYDRRVCAIPTYLIAYNYCTIPHLKSPKGVVSRGPGRVFQLLIVRGTKE